MISMSSEINVFNELILARKHINLVVSSTPPGTFWSTVLRFCRYLLGRCMDSLTQGSFDSIPDPSLIDLQIEDLFKNDNCKD